jgi:3-oxoacyl-[acyl-carrier-protein] synthase-1
LPPLVLSHFCLVTGLGSGLDATLSALRSGRSALAPCGFETAEFAAWVGEVEGLQAAALPPQLAAFDCRNNRLAELALATDGFGAAVAQARARYGPDRIGVFVGTSTSGIAQAESAYRRRDRFTGALPADFHYATTHNSFSLAGFLLQRLALAGPAAVISCACASSAKAFASAARMIAAGACDAAIVGGADSLCLTTLYGFHALELLAPGPCRPFDAERDGISIGEAAGFVLIERAERCRGAAGVLLLGIGESSDAYHMSSPHPEGAGARLAMERALAAAGLRPAAIDYLNLHGTATPIGDAAEDRAICSLFGNRTPCSSTKGQTGHTLGAAGITEAIVAALAIRHGIMPGNTGARRIDAALAARYLAAPEPGRVDRVMSNSFGFGGSNCSLVFGRLA